MYHRMLFEDLLSALSTRDNESEDRFIVSKSDLESPVTVMERGRRRRVLFEADAVEDILEKALGFQRKYDDANKILKTLREELRGDGDGDYEASYALLQECKSTLSAVSDILISVSVENQTISSDRVSALIRLLEDVSQRLPA